MTWPFVLGAGALGALIAVLAGWSIVLIVGVAAAVSAGAYLLLRPSYENAFYLMILTLPFFAAFVINLGGNFRVPYYFAVLAFILGFSQRRLYSLKGSPDVLLLFAFVGYALLSVALAFKFDPPAEVIAFGFRTSHFRPLIQAGQLCLMLIFFYLTVNYISTPDRLLKVSTLIFWSLLIVVVYSCYELVAVVFDVPFVNINTNPDFLGNRFAGTQLARAGDAIIPRPRSILSEPSQLSSYMAFSLPFAIAIRQHIKDRVFKLLILGFIATAMLIFVLAWSRAGFITVAVVAPLAFLLLPSWSTRLKLLAIGAVMYLLLSFIIFPVFGAKASLTSPVSLVAVRVETFKYLPQSFSEEGYGTRRIGRAFYVPLGVFKENPITGVGLGNYLVAKAASTDRPLQIAVAGNLYLELLTQFGIIGTSLFFMFVSVVLWRLMKTIAYYRMHPLRSLAVASLVSIVGMLANSTATGGLTTYGALWVALAIGVAIPHLRYRYRASSRLPTSSMVLEQNARA